VNLVHIQLMEVCANDAQLVQFQPTKVHVSVFVAEQALNRMTYKPIVNLVFLVSQQQVTVHVNNAHLTNTLHRLVLLNA